MKKPLRVFVVEDDPAYSTVLVHHLKKIGITDIHNFKSGEECIEALSKKPDVILLDFSLEGLNGLDTLRQIRKRKSKAKVAILTALESKEMHEKCLENGASAYLLKSDTDLNMLKQFLDEAQNTSGSFRYIVGLVIVVLTALLLLYFFVL